jgi:hypothetical protein
MAQHIDPITRCHYRDSGGRRCRSPREKGHPTFCSRHASLRARALEVAVTPESTTAADLTPDLLGPINDFRTNTAINYTLGRLLILKAADQISARDAATMAYICQLLLQSVPGVRKELSWSRKDFPEDDDLRTVVEATSSLWDDAEAPAPASTSGKSIS